MLRLINNSIKSKDKRQKTLSSLSASGLLTLNVVVLLLAGCAPRVATSFWKIGTPADSVREGYTVIHAEGKTRHCYPVTEWTSTDEKEDVYHSLHHHGVAVESELMAYRIYFDKKQTIDPYCKRTPQLELAESHWYPNDSLLAAGYGDDILRVSGTVGVGSVKLWNGKKQTHIENIASRTQRIVRQTRHSATIEVAVKGWQVPSAKRSYSDSGQCIDMKVQYTLKSSHRDMRCDVFCSSLGDSLPFRGGQEGPALCTGVQAIPAKGYLTAEGGLTAEAVLQQSDLTAEGGHCTFYEQLPNGVLLASWGTDWPVNDSAKYAKETVGLAVFIPKEYAGALVRDKQNNLCLLNLTGKAGLTAKRSYSGSGLTAQRSEMATVHFYLTVCGATKENHPVAKTAEEWYAYLKNWARKLK